MIKKIAVLGAGTMGHTIANTFAMAGYPVNLYESFEKVRETVKDKIRGELEFLVQEEYLKAEDVQATLDRITLFADLKEAVEDHRASASHAPRSIYGRIIAEADREISEDSVFRRTVQFGLEHYPEMNTEEHWRRFKAHMDEKYSSRGYIHLWIPGSENEKNLTEIRKIIESPTLLRQKFDKYFEEEKVKSKE